MKKCLRLTLITALVLSLCLSLSGCNMIGEMRAAHGIMEADGSITLNGEQYIELPISEALSPDYGNGMQYVYVTAADVPVLLSGILGDSYMASKDGVFLEYIESYELGRLQYCRSDKYADVAKAIKDGFTPVGYMYTYEVLVDPDLYETTTEQYRLSDAQAKALEKVLTDVIPATIYSEIPSEYVTELYLHSEDGYFSELACEVYYYDNGFLVITYDADGNTYLRKVPDGLNDIFADIMAKAIESTDTWNAFYEDMAW